MPPPSLLTSSLLPSNPLPLLPSSSSFKPTTTHKSPPTKLIKSTNTQESKPTINQIPSPPWMLTSSSSDQPLTLQHPKPTPKKPQPNKAFKSLSEKVRGGRSRQAMKKIVQGIKKLGKDEDENGQYQEVQEIQEVEDEKARAPWARVEGMVMAFPREKKERVATRAEREMERGEVERLREKAKGMRRWVKGKKAGVTQQVVDAILEEWRKGEELVMVKLVEPLARNMDRAMEIVEV